MPERIIDVLGLVWFSHAAPLLLCFTAFDENKLKNLTCILFKRALHQVFQIIIKTERTLKLESCHCNGDVHSYDTS